MKQRLLKLASPMYWFGVVAPFIVFAFYVLLLQTPRYESHALLMVEKDQTLSAVQSLDLGGMLGLGLGGGTEDALLISEFLQSKALFATLNGKYDLVGHWNSRTVDFISRLPADASAEDQHEYYLDMLAVQVDPDSKLIDVALQAFDPEFAQIVLQDIVASSEQFINDISRGLAQTQVSFVESELEGAHRRLRQNADHLLALQKRSDVLSPEAEAQASMEILGGLQGRKAGLETELRTLLSYLNDDAPDVVLLRRQLRAVNEQIADVRAGQTGGDGEGMNELLLEFKEAELAAELSADIYKVGLQTLETTRIEASRKAKFVVQVDPPNRPEEAAYPDTVRLLAFALFALHIFYFLAVLMWAAIQEHSE